jgi:high-affinity iron transporter
MDAFVITFREGLEAALAVAIIIGFLSRAGRADLRAWALAGVAAALVASVAGAMALASAGIGLESPATEAWTYLLATALMVSLVVWMLRHRGDPTASITRGLAARSEGVGIAAGLGVALFSFFMVGREGLETALFLGASALGSDRVPQTIGSVLGVAAAVALAFVLARGVARVDLRSFFTVTAVALGLLALKFAAGSLLGFAEIGAVPSTEAFRSLLEAFAEGPVGVAVTLAAVAAPVAVVTMGLVRRPPHPAASH